jgi:hypothetical protein
METRGCSLYLDYEVNYHGDEELITTRKIVAN